MLVGALAAVIGWQQVEQYQSEESIWTERPTFLDINLGGNPELSSALNQSNRLNQWLQTSSFRENIIARVRKTQPDYLAGAENNVLAKNFNIKVSGNNLLTVRSLAATPEQARDQAQALYDAARERYLAEVQAQSQDTTEVYRKRTTELTAQQDVVNKSITVYLANRADLRSNPAAATLEPELARLRSQSQVYQNQLDALQGRIETIQQALGVGIQGNTNLFRLEDRPFLPLTRSGTARFFGAGLFGLLGGLAGLVLGLVYLAFLATFDRSLAHPRQLAALTGLPTYCTPYRRPARPLQSAPSPLPARRVEAEAAKR